jgi:4-alpha-glucanotransferase
MTSTHDLPTVAGWWRGRDIEVRGQLGSVATNANRPADEGPSPSGEHFARLRSPVAPPPPDQGARRDAAVQFIACNTVASCALPLKTR